MKPLWAATVSFLALLLAHSARADLEISSLGAAPTITFDATLANVNNGAFAGNGFQPSPTSGRLDSDTWAVTGNAVDGPSSNGSLEFGESDTSNDFARGGGEEGVSSGGIYGFDRNEAGGGGNVNRAIGVQQTDTHFTPGTITLAVKNTTGSAAHLWTVSFELYSYNDQASASSITFSYSTTDTTGTGNSSLYTAVPLLDFASPTTADAGEVDWSAASAKSTTIVQSIAHNATLYLRWTFDDASGTGNRDQLAIDNIGVSVAVPEPSALIFGTLVCGVICFSAAWRRGARNVG